MIIYVYAIFSRDRLPLAVGIKIGDDKKIFNIYGRGYNTTVHNAEQVISSITKIINSHIANGGTVVTADFKSLLSAFPINKVQNVDYKVYDVSWHIITPTDDGKDARKIVSSVLDRLTTVKIKEWHKIFANAAIVYQSLEDRGVAVNTIIEKPIWEQTTYSGRSKNIGLNAQGFSERGLSIPGAGNDYHYIYFDWVAADIRVASILSNDIVLQQSFVDSDPYSVVSNILSDESVTITRDECKFQLLRAINSFDFSHPILEHIYIDLGRWLQKSKDKLNSDGYLESILGRRFNIKSAKNNNPLAVLNGVLQGSVAHAMQSSIKRIWDNFGGQLLVEVFDSVVLLSKPEYVESTISGVVEIMSRQFGYYFPVRVSVGDEYKQWRPRYIFRENAVERLDHGTRRKEEEEISITAEE